jgi:hypothetical protein
VNASVIARVVRRVVITPVAARGRGRRRLALWLPAAYLLHDSGFALGKGNVSTRLIADELDLNLASLAAALLVIVIVVVGTRTLALDAAGLGGDGISIAVRLVQVGGRCLIVLVGDVGHFCQLSTLQGGSKKAKMVEMLF